jgi:hypothetical protein
VRRRTIVLAVALTALVLTPTLAFGGLAGVASNAQTYPDTTGEDAAAPDVTSIAVANDDAGAMSFQINVSNRPALTADMLFLIYIDSIPGAGDGQSLGADYVLQLIPAGVALFKWNGSDYPFEPSSASFAYTTGGPTIRVSATDLGKPKTINFFVLAVSGITEDANGDPVFTDADADFAPNFGTYAYEVKTTLVLSVVNVTTSPRPARAGKAFSAALAVTRNDTSGLVLEGTVACRAKIGSVTVPVKARRLANGVAACSWTLPKNAKGKMIRGTVTLTVDGTKVTRPFSAKIT